MGKTSPRGRAENSIWTSSLRFQNHGFQPLHSQRANTRERLEWPLHLFPRDKTKKFINYFLLISIHVGWTARQKKNPTGLSCYAEDLSWTILGDNMFTSVKSSAGTWHWELAVNNRTVLLSRHKYLFTTPIILIFKMLWPTLISRDWAQRIHDAFKTYVSVTMTTSSMHPVGPKSPVIRTM